MPPTTKPLRPTSSISTPADLGPLGFLKVEPAHGKSNGVPALRQRNSRPCSSLSLAGDSSPRPSLASRITTGPRLLERYLNEIWRRPSCFTFPRSSITLTSVSTSPHSPPSHPPFM